MTISCTLWALLLAGESPSIGAARSGPGGSGRDEDVLGRHPAPGRGMRAERVAMRDLDPPETRAVAVEQRFELLRAERRVGAVGHDERAGGREMGEQPVERGADGALG